MCLKDHQTPGPRSWWAPSFDVAQGMHAGFSWSWFHLLSTGMVSSWNLLQLFGAAQAPPSGETGNQDSLDRSLSTQPGLWVRFRLRIRVRLSIRVISLGHGMWDMTTQIWPHPRAE